MTRQYRLGDKYADLEKERGILAHLVRDPQAYWRLLDFLPDDALAHEGDTWRRLVEAIQTDQPVADIVPDDWRSTATPDEDEEVLADLYQRRMLCHVQERLAAAISDTSLPADRLVTTIEEQLAEVQRAIQERSPGRLQLASDLVLGVLADARERARARQETGQPVMGLTSGIRPLDEKTGGWQTGLYLLAAGPGMGKTTLAVQMAQAAVRKEAAAVFVTFENSVANIVTKMVCARAGISSRDTQQGLADPERLSRAAVELEPVLRRVALIEGTSRLTVAELRARALQMMARLNTDKCLIVVDYLQIWAKASSELRGMMSARERTEALTAELRQVSTRLNCPVLAIASQNRANGNYSKTQVGAPGLDSLKESGDLEYAADMVMFLSPSTERHEHEPTRAIDLTIAKNRNGELGKVELVFRADTGVMRPVAVGGGISV